MEIHLRVLSLETPTCNTRQSREKKIYRGKDNSSYFITPRSHQQCLRNHNNVNSTHWSSQNYRIILSGRHREMSPGNIGGTWGKSSISVSRSEEIIPKMKKSTNSNSRLLFRGAEVNTKVLSLIGWTWKWLLLLLGKDRECVRDCYLS